MSLQLLLDVPSPRAEEYAAFSNRLRLGVTPGTELVGTKHFFRCDYMVHRRPGFMTSVHM